MEISRALFAWFIHNLYINWCVTNTLNYMRSSRYMCTNSIQQQQRHNSAGSRSNFVQNLCTSLPIITIIFAIKRNNLTIQWALFFSSFFSILWPMRTGHVVFDSRRRLSDSRPKETAKMSINNVTTYCLYMDIKIFPHKINYNNSASNNREQQIQPEPLGPKQQTKQKRNEIRCVFSSMFVWFTSHNMLYRSHYTVA